MSDKGASIYAEGVEDVEEVVHVGVEVGVAVEVEVVGVDAACTDEIIEDDAVVPDEEGEDALPRRLVGSKTVGEDEDPVAGAFNPHVEDLQEIVTHLLGGSIAKQIERTEEGVCVLIEEGGLDICWRRFFFAGSKYKYLMG